MSRFDGTRIILWSLAIPAAFATSGPTLAASFDCAKAGTVTEKRICANPALSRDDEAMAAAYAKAFAATPFRLDLRDAQLDWIANTRDKTSDAAMLHQVMLDRIAELDDGAKADAAAAKPARASVLATVCVGPGVEGATCSVEGSGRIAPNLAWQLRAYEQDGRRAAVGETIFVVEGEEARPILWRNMEGANFGEPERIPSPEGAMLDLPGEMDGSGHFSAEALFALDDAGPRQINISAIPSELSRHLPAGMGLWKGIYPDWRKMTVWSQVWKPSDANCCPTGGSVSGALKRSGQRVTVERVVYDRKPVE